MDPELLVTEYWHVIVRDIKQSWTFLMELLDGDCSAEAVSSVQMILQGWYSFFVVLPASEAFSITHFICGLHSGEIQNVCTFMT